MTLIADKGSGRVLRENNGGSRCFSPQGHLITFTLSIRSTALKSRSGAFLILHV